MWNILKQMSPWIVLGAVAFMIVQIVSDLFLPTFTSDIINDGVATGNTEYIWQVGLKMAGFTVISILAATGNVFLASRQSQKLGKSLRSQIYSRVENYSINEFDQIGTASLITRTTNDVMQIQNFTMMLLRMMIMAPLMLVGASFMAYQKDAKLTMVFTVALPILAIVVVAVMRHAVPLFQSMQKKTDQLNLIFREGLTGIRVIRAFNRSGYELERFDEANTDYTNTAIKVNTILSFMFPMMTLVMSGTNIAIVWFGAHYVGEQSMGVGNLIAFMTYATQILMSFMMLSMVFVLIPRAQVSATRINEVLELKTDIIDPQNPKTIQHGSYLTFHHVNFRFKGAEKLALHDISFEAKPGETIAIIGGTGSGKSSLISLIPRFYDAESGTIEVNGIRVQDVLRHDLRQKIGFVPQKAVLFTGTIRDNIKFGKENASDEEIWHALDIAQIKDFVITLPDGLDTYVEQGGNNFSGGQKQRLSIARALVRKPDIYIFDDSFSALDYNTDSKLRKALKKETRNAIVLIVSQRISTVTDADTIIVLDEGEIVGKGTHQMLCKENKTYQEIFRSQLREEDMV